MEQFQQILHTTPRLLKEFVPTGDGLNRVLADPVKARTSLPAFDISAVEGYALRRADITSLPAILKLAGESSSAKPFTADLDYEAAVKIFPGGKLPNGADSVVAASQATLSNGYLTIQNPPMFGENTCPAGIDFNTDDVALEAGTMMTARLIGLASTMHVMWLPVVRKPRVAVFAIGSELAIPGETSPQKPVTASSLYSFSADIIEAGGEPIILGVSSDQPEEIKQKIAEARGCDLLITTGGTSPAANQLVNKVLAEVTKEAVQDFRVEINRNDHMLFTRTAEQMPICSLPGNPISSKIYFTLFITPLIHRLLGLRTPPKRYAVLGRTVDEFDTKVGYLHARLSVDENGAYKVIPVSAQDGFLLSELAKSDCLAVMGCNTALKKGDFVEIIPFGSVV
jgi:molybdopterin molybdotransferase